MKKLLALLVVGGLLTMITGCPPSPSTKSGKTPPKTEKKGDAGKKGPEKKEPEKKEPEKKEPEKKEPEKKEPE
ncbi:MAG TPA: hypothetical protein VMG10_32320, partial [Gemmataceae bacterium]|nr:hypothetical protein [Gemmataceae bacterium]